MKRSRKLRTQRRVFASAVGMLLAVFAISWKGGVIPGKAGAGATRQSAPPSNLDTSAHALLSPKPALEYMARLPLAFEANHGQAAASIKFLAPGTGSELLLTSRSITVPSRSGVIGIRFAGTNGPRTIQGEDPLPGQRNYLLGNKRNNWHTNVPTFRKVRY